MDKILNMLSGYLAAAQQVLQHYGPAVWSATVRLIQFQGIWNLAVGAIFLLFGLVCVYFLCRVLFLWSTKTDSWAWDGDGHGYSSNEPTATGVVVLILSAILSLVFVISSCAYLLDFSSWLDAFAPQLAILYALAIKAGIL